MWGELAFSFQSGNYYIISIMVLAFFSSVIIFERLIMLQFVFNIDFSRFLLNFKKMIASEDMDRAMNLCRSVSKTSLPKIALKALEASENDPTTVRGTIEEETIDFLPRIESRISSLPSLATLIMLVGILGTIDSLWSAFHSIDVLDTAKKQASLATGIAGALNPTALGLIACTIILAFHQMLRGFATGVVEQIHHGVTVLTNLLVPPDVAFVAPVAASRPAIHADEAPATTGAAEAAPPAEEGVPSDDAFDDASVEDIKDEEEII